MILDLRRADSCGLLSAHDADVLHHSHLDFPQSLNRDTELRKLPPISSAGQRSSNRQPMVRLSIACQQALCSLVMSSTCVVEFSNGLRPTLQPRGGRFDGVNLGRRTISFWFHCCLSTSRSSNGSDTSWACVGCIEHSTNQMHILLQHFVWPPVVSLFEVRAGHLTNNVTLATSWLF